MKSPFAQSGCRSTATLRRETQALIRSLRFCLIPMPSSEYKFAEVRSMDSRLSRDKVEFLVYLMEDRTIGEVLRALTRAAEACHFGEAFAFELGSFFTSLGRTLKYNASAFVIEPPQRPDIRATLSGFLPRIMAEAAKAANDGREAELPELPRVANDSAMLEIDGIRELPTVKCEAESSTVAISAA